MNKLVFIDVETTGTDHKRHGIHQLSGILEENGSVVDQFNIRVKPSRSCEIVQEALDVSGVSLDDLEQGVEERHALLEMTQKLGRLVNRFDRTDKAQFVAYNAPFDQQFTQELFRRCNNNFFGAFFWRPGWCVFQMASMRFWKDRPFMENFKLSTVCKHAGIDVDQDRLHDSMYDIELTRNLFWTLMER